MGNGWIAIGGALVVPGRPLNLGTTHLLSLQGRLVEPDPNGRFDKLDPILLYCGRISSPCKATRFELLWNSTLASQHPCGVSSEMLPSHGDAIFG